MASGEKIIVAHTLKLPSSLVWQATCINKKLNKIKQGFVFQTGSKTVGPSCCVTLINKPVTLIKGVCWGVSGTAVGN